MKMLKARGNNETQRIYLKGKKSEPEPTEFYVHFPGGFIGVTRCSDSSYWVHINAEELDENGNRIRQTKIVDSRIDSQGLSASQMDVGDIARPDCYHIAVKLERKS